MFLVAEKWRSAVNIGSMRVLTSFGAVEAYFALALKPNKRADGVIEKLDGGNLFAWRVFDDKDPVLVDKDSLKKLRAL